MIQLRNSEANKVLRSKKDFFFFNLDRNNVVINYILTNDFKRKNEFTNFRVVSTLQKEHEFITL